MDIINAEYSNGGVCGYYVGGEIFFPIDYMGLIEQMYEVREGNVIITTDHFHELVGHWQTQTAIPLNRFKIPELALVSFLNSELKTAYNGIP